ncbi:glycosyl hydrolase family 18 protein [Paenibacillus sp. TRM 82003]|nr:glycosyl hydrolase family 18 protein [Paenibacillus sp. TRM 82003]
MAVLTVWYYRSFGPVDTRIVPDYGADKPVFYNGEVLQGTAVGEGESLALPLGLIQSTIDTSVAYEESSESIIITTDRQVVRLVTEQLTAWANDKPFELRFPTEAIDGEIYVPIEPLERLYGITLLEHPETGYVILRKPGDVITRVEAPKDGERPEPALLRQEPTVRAPIVSELSPGEQAYVWGESEGWYFVQVDNGTLGYADKNSLRWAGTETVPPSGDVEDSPFVVKRPMGERIMLTWEQVYSKNPNTSAFGEMPGLNVVSPTWFHLLDEEGKLENRADASYVKWAHDRGIQVWALFSNNFDPDMTSEALSTYDRRMHMARQLISWAELYRLDGINIDFENMHVEDGPLLTQFVRELTPLLHEAGLTVSIDVTFISTSPNWSMFYDRKALGAVVDYMMVMAYDEHWASSPVAGSVGSLPWVENGVKRIIEQGVPPSKIVLGVPFYTRIWTEQTVDGKQKVSSKAVGMDTVRGIVAEKKLKPVLDAATGQNYVEYEEDGALKKIWIEDDTSMKGRVEIAKKLGLAGIASWSRNFANDSVWRTIEETMYAK